MAGAAGAASDPALPDALKSCARIVEDAARLACFDREVTALSGVSQAPQATSAAPVAPVAEAAPVTTAAASTAAAPPGAVAPAATEGGAATASPRRGPDASSQPGALSPEQSFGLSLAEIRKLQTPQGEAAATLKKLTAHVATVYHNAAGRQVFTLDNGQVWRQAETKPDFTAGPGTAVTISTGALGSYWVETGPHNWTRVERVR